MSCTLAGRRLIAAMTLAFALLAGYGFFYLPANNVGAQGSDAVKVLASKFAGSDAVTARIRDESSILSRVYISGPADLEKAKQLGTVVQDFGSFVIVAHSRAAAARQFGLEEQVMETTVNLPGASFEPLGDAPEGSLRLGKAATAPGKGYYVLQFGASPSDEWLKSIRDAGVEILQYIPHQAFFVYGEADAIARVADHSRVRWIGEYKADQKLSPVFRSQLDAARRGTAAARGVSPLEMARKNTATFEIAVFARADIESFAADLQGTYARGGVRVSRLQHNYFNVVRAELSLADIEAVAALPDVISIDPVVKSRNEDERSAQIIAGNYLNPTTILGPGYNPLSQFGADGTNVAVSVVDDGVGIPGEGGFYLSSLNTVHGPLRGAPSGALGHGHFNATIIAGSNPFGPTDPLFYNYGIGIAPRAHIVSIPRNRTGYNAPGGDVDVYNDSVTTPAPNGTHAFISNNSWGDGLNGNGYSVMEARFDGFVRDASIDPGIDPITMVFSAGNAGQEGLTRPKVAKNLIAVGNSEASRSELANATANNIDDLAVDSSRGPAADGRIKPDIVAPGTAITGGRSGKDSLRGNIDAFHRWSTGTSHSAAHISGVAALFTHWWYSTNLGDRPSPSLIKAALINSARDMNGEGSSAAIPNRDEGWGRPNLKSMFNTGVGMRYIDESVPLQENGEGFDLNGSVADGTKPVRITLVWTDPPGVSDPALVNDIDLTVTVNGTVYKGNVFSNGASVTGGTADDRNNLENVFLPAGIPAGSPLQITVRARALNGDGILGNGDDTDQHYSLVVYNYSASVSPAFYTVSGRVTSPAGRGIGLATVRIVDSQGVAHERRTNPLGYFKFSNVPGGQSYTINVRAKRYTFPQQTFQLNSNALSVNVVANSPSGP